MSLFVLVVLLFSCDSNINKNLFSGTIDVLSNLCRATSGGYINFGCSREVLFRRGYFHGQCHCAWEIFLPVERGSRSLEVPLKEVRQYRELNNQFNSYKLYRLFLYKYCSHFNMSLIMCYSFKALLLMTKKQCHCTPLEYKAVFC